MSIQINHILKTAAVAPGRGRTHEPPDGPSFRQILEATSQAPEGFPGQRPPLSKQALLEVIRIVQAQMNQSLLRAMSAEDCDDRDIRLPFLSDRLFPLNRTSPERHFEKQRQAGLRADSETSASPAPHPVIPPEREPLKPAPARRHPDDQGRRMNLDPIIQEAAAAHGIDPELIKSVIRVESNFDPNSTSPKGAMGLMQLMPGTARELGVQNAYDPAENIRAGTRYLNMLLNRYEGNVTMALAAYNWGMGNLERRPAQMPLETKSYIRSVIRHFEQAKA